MKPPLLASLFACLTFAFIGLAMHSSQAEETKPTEATEATAEERTNSGQSSKERYFRQAEREFTNRDLNQNLVIDEDEWQSIYEEQRAASPKELLEQSPEKMAAIDRDKDGALTDAEVNAWIRERFEKRFKRYLNSEIYKSRKAEYDKEHGGN